MMEMANERLLHKGFFLNPALRSALMETQPPVRWRPVAGMCLGCQCPM